MKVITITENGWLMSLPKIQRPVILHRVANLAQQDDDTWVIRVQDGHYGKAQRV